VSGPRAAPRVLPGVAALGAVALANLVVWAAARPPGQPGARYLGEALAAEAVLLFSCSLLLVSILGPVERAFGGIDRGVLWHRHTAVAGTVLLIPHVALVTATALPGVAPIGSALGDVALFGIVVLVVWALAPGLRAARRNGIVRRLARVTFERWLTAHRLTGLFVAAAVAHGAIVDPVLHRSAVLLVAFLVSGGPGLAAYAYRELLPSRAVPSHPYRVAAVRRPSETALEVDLDPVAEPLSFVAGQFVLVAFGGHGAWQPHPFSVTSPPGRPRLELAIKAAGGYTIAIHDRLRPGAAAKVDGPFGAFDFRTGGRRQVWVAGGIGIAPFVAWTRGLGHGDGDDRDIDLYYSVAHAGDAIYRDEIDAAAARCPSFRPHLHVSEDGGLLDARDVLAGIADPASAWVYLCGPPAMMKSFEQGLRRSGVPGSQIRWERFSVR
jgi:predicted ferric reductase